MKSSRISAVSFGLVVVAMAVVVHSSPAHAIMPLPVDAGVSADVKVRMQADLASSTGAQVDLRGDGRVYKGNGQGNAEGRGSTSASSPRQDSSDDDTKQGTGSATVESDDDSVDVSYKVRGKFLGFIPMGMLVRTSIGSAGEVKVSHPWYSFLVSSDDDNIQADLMSDVEAIKTEFGVTAGAKIATSTKSDFIKAVHDILKSAFSAKASADASASATAN